MYIWTILHLISLAILQASCFSGYITYIPSSSTIVISSKQSVCTETPVGKDDESRDRVKTSFCSNTSSSIIETLNITLVCPAGIVAMKGPGT